MPFSYTIMVGNAQLSAHTVVVAVIWLAFVIWNIQRLTLTITHHEGWCRPRKYTYTYCNTVWHNVKSHCTDTAIVKKLLNVCYIECGTVTHLFWCRDSPTFPWWESCQSHPWSTFDLPRWCHVPSYVTLQWQKCMTNYFSYSKNNTLVNRNDYKTNKLIFIMKLIKTKNHMILKDTGMTFEAE